MLIATIGYVWVEKNNQTTLSSDFSCAPEDLFAELNEIAEFWDNPGLEDIVKLGFPASWGKPTVDEPSLSSLALDQGLSLHFESFLDDSWKTFARKLSESDEIVMAIWTPNDSDPWTWYELPDDEKADHILPGESVNFDQYRFGSLTFETSHTDIQALLEEFSSQVRPLLERYSNSPGPYGPGNLNHRCDSACNFDPCIRLIALPASLSIAE